MTRTLRSLAALIALAGCAGSGGGRRAQEAPAAEREAPAPAADGAAPARDEAARGADEGYPIRAWPLLESVTSSDGSRTFWATPFFHTTTHPDGSTEFHVLNYLQGATYWAFLPLAYRGGEPGRKHTGVAPLYFGGPGYDVVPPALFYNVDGEEGSHLGVALLYHRGPNGWCLPPLLTGSWIDDGTRRAWVTPLFVYTRTPEGEAAVKLAGLFPLYQRTPKGWFVPPLVSGGWEEEDGGRSTWVTPFFHHRSDAEGTRSFHVLNYLHGRDYDVLLPLAYAGGEEGRRRFGIIPLYFHGPGYRCLPLLMSGIRRPDEGGHRLWVTPLFHHSEHADGATSWHFLNYFHAPRFKFLFPLAYLGGEEGARYGGIIPLYFQGPKTACLPLLLSGSTPYGEKGRTTWVTPFFNYAHDGEGTSWWHALSYFHGPDYDVLFPLAYRVGQPGERYAGIVPLYFQSPTTVCVPPLLSGSRRWGEKGRTTWVTPFFHYTHDGEGRAWMHALNYFQGPTYNSFAPFVFSFGEPGEKHLWALPFYMHGPDYRFLLPLVYAVGEEGRKYRGVVPLYFESPRSIVVPPALFGRWDHEDGGRSTWVTPFFHRMTDGEGRSWWHVLNYFQGPDYKLLPPLAYEFGEEGERYRGIVPLYFESPGMGCAPFLLSGWWKKGDGGRTCWATPLFHYTDDGVNAPSFHVLNYFQGPGYKSFFPLVFVNDDGGLAVAPLFAGGKNYLYLPPALSCWYRNAEGGRTLWVTPFFRHATDGEGRTWFHALNYFQSPDSRCLFPFFYHSDDGDLWLAPGYFGGKDYLCLPPLLSGWRRRDDGGDSLWVTPLFHRTRDGAGGSWWHLLNYFQGPNHKLLFPFFYSVGSPEERHLGVIPLYFQTPTACSVPLALSASWRRKDGGRTTWVTPLFHQRTAADGALQSRHLLNWFETERFQTLFPAYWRAGDTRAFVPPLYVSYANEDGGRTRSVLWPLSAARTGGSALDRSWSTQLKPFVYQRAGDDYEFNFLWRLFHVRRMGARSQLAVSPLWWSESGGEGTPAGYQILGGLFARDCNYTRKTYRYRLLWVIPVSGDRTY
ncbi:MAG TPA: hypothetical protein DCM87_09810 [Planctomycetes bacterium]|nr:hypothetical protein [Planctomycetota bacterium]